MLPGKTVVNLPNHFRVAQCQTFHLKGSNKTPVNHQSWNTGTLKMQKTAGTHRSIKALGKFFKF